MDRIALARPVPEVWRIDGNVRPEPDGLEDVEHRADARDPLSPASSLEIVAWDVPERSANSAWLQPISARASRTNCAQLGAEPRVADAQGCFLHGAVHSDGGFTAPYAGASAVAGQVHSPPNGCERHRASRMIPNLAR